MKLSITDAEVVVRNKALEKLAEDDLVTFDILTMADVKTGTGDLTKQDQPFFQFHVQFNNSRRVGPGRSSPTRYYADLYFSYFTKEPNYLRDVKLQEEVANWFAEQTIDGVRFRTFTPYPKSKDNGFTQYLGVIDFDFELYRGA